MKKLIKKLVKMFKKDQLTEMQIADNIAFKCRMRMIKGGY